MSSPVNPTMSLTDSSVSSSTTTTATTTAALGTRSVAPLPSPSSQIESVSYQKREKTCADKTWQVVAVVIGGTLLASSIIFSVGTVVSITQSITFPATVVSIATAATATTALSVLWGAGLATTFCLGTVVLVLALRKGREDLYNEISRLKEDNRSIRQDIAELAVAKNALESEKRVASSSSSSSSSSSAI